MKKPNFFIVGAAKAGTTSLAKYLSEHPDIFIPKEKEPRYFVKNALRLVNEKDPMKENLIGTSTLNKREYYKKYDVKECFAGDASVHYLYHHKEAIPRIKDELGDVPIFIMIRNPVDRLISHYNYLPDSKRSLIEEFFQEEKNISCGFNSFWYIKSLSFYSKSIKAYTSSFSKVKIIVFEDFILNTDKYYQECLTFLGAKPYSLKKYDVYNKASNSNFLLKVILKIGSYKIIKKITPQFFIGNLKEVIVKKSSAWFFYQNKEEIDHAFKSKAFAFYRKDIDEITRNHPEIDISPWFKYPRVK